MRSHSWPTRLVVSLCSFLALSCGSPAEPEPPDPNAVTLDACTFRPMVRTARTGGVVQAGALSAGAAEHVIDAPVGTTLGAYTRAGFLGGQVDDRVVPFAGKFVPSVGIAAAPRVKALALTAGDSKPDDGSAAIAPSSPSTASSVALVNQCLASSMRSCGLPFGFRPILRTDFQGLSRQ